MAVGFGGFRGLRLRVDLLLCMGLRCRLSGLRFRCYGFKFGGVGLQGFNLPGLPFKEGVEGFLSFGGVSCKLYPKP